MRSTNFQCTTTPPPLVKAQGNFLEDLTRWDPPYRVSPSATMSDMYERNYTIKRGEVWERLIIPKDKRTHRKRVPTQAAASVLIDTVAYVLPTEITSEGGVLIQLNENQTEWLADGVYPWDMVITVSRSSLLTSTPLAETLAVGGTLTVVTEVNITPMASDGVTEALVAV